MPKIKTHKKASKKKAPAKDYDSLFNAVLIDISENGKSARSALKGVMSSQKFYQLLEEEEKSKRYARACEMRADVIADQIMEISDNVGNDLITLPDGREIVDNAVVQRDKLRVDSRKWILAKLHPKKYGEKIDMTSDGKSLVPQSIKIEIINNTDQVKKDDTGR